MNKAFKYIMAAAALVVIFSALVIALIPDDFIERVLRRQMEKNASISFSAESFGKALPFGLKASGVRFFLPGEGAELVYFDKINVSLNPIYLFIGRLRFNAKGIIGGGEISSIVTFIPGAVTMDVRAYNVSVASIPALRAAGLKGSGVISGNSAITVPEKSGCPDGSLNIEGAGIDLNGFNAAGLNVLLRDKADITLALDSKACKATIKNLLVDGKSLKLKLYGDVVPEKILSKSRIDLTLEAIPRDDEGILALFPRYRKSSRFYSLRLTGQIASPAVTP